MLIRALTTVEECRRVTELERAVWEYADAEDSVPLPLLAVSIKRGGILLGAFEPAGRMVGFVYSMPAIKDARTTQWSHALGVAGDARDRGVGRALKMAQREHALGMGIDLIEWTFDPLQSLNAHFNFARLGVVVEDYEENIYGESSSPLHRGTPTDRFVAEWRLAAPHVERRLTSSGAGLIRDSGVASAVVVNPSRTTGVWLAPGDADLENDARRVLVEIPAGFTSMQAGQPNLALDWRLATRAIFQSYFRRGYRAVDFFFSTEAGRGQYLLAKKEAVQGAEP
jgi:predicted GNAT superfamily acetyltransferase